MNQEIKARWVTALRSGEYKQGIGMLRRENGDFCCLGVLCDLHSKETGNEWYTEKLFSYFYYLQNKKVLPVKVQEWSGVDAPWQQHTLFDLNDRALDTFPVIAEWIDQNL